MSQSHCCYLVAIEIRVCSRQLWEYLVLSLMLHPLLGEGENKRVIEGRKNDYVVLLRIKKCQGYGY